MLITRVFKSIYRYIQLKHDSVTFAKKLGVKIGKNVRLLGVSDKTFSSEPYLVSIDDHVTITDQVQFITHDGAVWVFREKEEDIEFIRPIKIGNNVFIGYRTIIMPGVNVGDNVVIGAGSLVISDIPDNSVAAGVPAKVIRSVNEYRNKIEPFTIKRSWANEKDKKKILYDHFKIVK